MQIEGIIITSRKGEHRNKNDNINGMKAQEIKMNVIVRERKEGKIKQAKWIELKEPDKCNNSYRT